MTRYLLSVHIGAHAAPDSISEEQAREGYARISTLEREMEAAGALVFSARLDAPDSARVVRAANGKVLTTDGPYLEAKEAIGGFYIVEAANLDDAVSWASKTSAAIGMPIEVRPFFDSRQPE